MSRFSGFLQQTSHYSIAQFLLIFASTISFPILTRIFTPAEYGVMNLVSNAIVILLAVSKAGLQHGIVRFHSEYSSGEQQARRLVASALYGGVAIAMLVAAVWFLFIFVLVHFRVSDPMIETLLLLSGALIFLRAVENLLLAFLRAEQRTVHLNVYRVLAKYFTLGIILLALFAVSRSLITFYTAQIFALAISCMLFWHWRARYSGTQLADFSQPLFRQVLLYGLPLVGFELGSLLLNFADRYLIQFFHGSDEVGLYSAGYNLADYVKDLVVLPMATAVVPIYMQIWTEKGAYATQVFLRKALKSYLLLAIPLVFGCIALREDLLNVLASQKFLEGSAVIPWALAGMMLNGALPILAAGMYIHKKTGKLVGILALAIAANIAINLWAIPVWGIRGAAVSKLLCFTILVALAAHSSTRDLDFRIPWKSALHYTAAAALMYAVLSLIEIANPLLSLAVEIIAGAAVYFAIVWFVEPSVREQIHAVLKKIKLR